MKTTLFVGFICLLTNSVPALADLASTFNSGKENWRTAGDAGAINWKAQGGNPAGYIEATDLGRGITWYFMSPASWTGNWLKYKNLSFDLKQVGTGNDWSDKDLIIVGKNGKKLSWQGERGPSAAWSFYSISLNPKTFKTTQANYDSIMANVDRILIRGEFIEGNDVGGLDNVRLSETSSQVKGTVYGFGAYVLTCKNITTGITKVISNNVKLDWDCEKSGLVVRDGDSISVTLKGNATK